MYDREETVNHVVIDGKMIPRKKVSNKMLSASNANI